MRIHIYGSSENNEEAGRLINKVASAQPSLKPGQSSFVDIHYHGKDAGQIRENLVPATNSGLGKGGQAAFLDIHYHGKDAELLTANPGGVGGPSLVKGGQTAFLDIHYHGKEGLERLPQGVVAPESAEEGGGLVSSSSAVTNALRGRSITPNVTAPQPISKGGGSAAFLDIHYHGKDVGALQGEPVFEDVQPGVAGKLGQAGGTQAFVDIHYHGKKISPSEISGKPGLHVGDAAFLDIHYHG
jgi:hypothetical protein